MRFKSVIKGDTVRTTEKETGCFTETDEDLAYPWFEIKWRNMKGNIYHSGFEQSVELIKEIISEMEEEETCRQDAHLPYQMLLKFFYDVRNIINT